MSVAPARKPGLVIPSAPAGMVYRPLYEYVLLERIHLMRTGTLADNLETRPTPELVLHKPDLSREYRERTLGQAVFARVLAVGRGRVCTDGRQRPVNPALVPGQLVVTFTLAGRGITGYGDEDRFCVVEDDVLAVIDDPASIAV